MMPVDADSSYTEYFQDDEDFLEVLRSAVLPGDIEKPTTPIKSNKRKHEPDSPAFSESSNTNLQAAAVELDNHDTYGSLKFGDFGEYMRRKRAKLQIQDADVRNNQENDEEKQIFKGLAIYVSQIFQLFEYFGDFDEIGNFR